MINRNFFMERVKLKLFGGSFAARQRDGLIAILDTWEASQPQWDDRWLAYMLATAHHETDRKMQPIREYGGRAYYIDRYDVSGRRPTLARKMGNAKIGDGATYYGRGFVQLTWKSNYQRAGTKIGADLVGDPDLALDPTIASAVMLRGMHEGWFTGKKFGDYFNASREDWVNARRIINGLDKASLIAGYGEDYYAAISHTV